jgi:hypothetical protein
MPPRLAIAPHKLAEAKERVERGVEPLQVIADGTGCSRTALYRFIQENGWVRGRTGSFIHGLVPASAADEQNLTEESAAELPREEAEAHEAFRRDPVGERPNDLAERVSSAVEQQLQVIDAILARLPQEPGRSVEAERHARTLASLTRTLQALRQMGQQNDAASMRRADQHDDIPTDMDEFRRELARRLEAIVTAAESSRPAAGDG